MKFTKNQNGLQKLMKVSKALALVTIVGLLAMVACRKEVFKLPSTSQKSFFKSGNEAFAMVQQMINHYHKDEKLEAIERIGYLQAKDTSYAFVVYRSNKGKSNISIQKTMLSEDVEGLTSYKCDGEDCDCRVSATVGADGTIHMICSCSSCYLLSR